MLGRHGLKPRLQWDVHIFSDSTIKIKYERRGTDLALTFLERFAKQKEEELISL